MPAMTRSMAKKMAMAEVVLVEATEPSPSPSITDVPLEVLEMILRNLDCGSNSMLPYRLVSSLWKSIIEDLLEKKTLKGNIDACPTLRASNEWPKINCPDEMIRHTGNPFPSSSLVVSSRIYSAHLGRNLPFRYNRHFRLDNFMSKVGSHLTTFILRCVCLQTTENLCKILTHLPNLKALKIKRIFIDWNNEEPFPSLPALPHLTKLELKSNHVGFDDCKSSKFCAWFVDAYAEQFEHLDLKLVGEDGTVQLDPLPPALPENCPMQQLRLLKIFQVGADFFQRSCSPPLQHLFIGRLSLCNELSLALLIRFVDKFSNTLETLDLGVGWSQFFNVFPGRPTEDKLRLMLEHFFAPKKDEEAIRLSILTVFPKLTKLTWPFPCDDVATAVMSKMILPKFPALRKLNLGYVIDAKFGDRETCGQKITKLLTQEDYWALCSKLSHISVWYTGEDPDVPYNRKFTPNYLVFTARRENNQR